MVLGIIALIIFLLTVCGVDIISIIADIVEMIVLGIFDND